jgi:hypothetical protein
MGFAIEVLVSGETTWPRNGCVYQTREDADASGRDLLSRWYAAREYRVITVPEEPNQDKATIYGAGHRVKL